MISQSLDQIHTEIARLREQLAQAEHEGRTLGDARLRMFLKNKLRHLEADIAFQNREVARSAVEQSEWRRRAR